MTSPAEVLIVDDEPNIRFVLSELLRREGLIPVEAANGQEAIDLVRSRLFAVVIMDVRMPRVDGLTALKEMRVLNPEIMVIMITAHGNEKTAVECMEAGAYDYFTKPFDLNEVRVVLRRALERVRLQEELRSAREAGASRYAFDNIVGQSESMRSVYATLARVAETDVTVLVTGESGTGKELIAAAVHHNSPRRNGPFIKVNTVAIPDTLLESELFGHEKGSFTGAVAQKIGKVEAAHGGTLFLDEIGDMPMALQGKLLRALQEREVERVGSTKTVKVDIRVVCATNRDLAVAVEKGTFREDLYYRINVLPIWLPPLRQRREDIPLLVDHFIEVYNPRLQKNIRSVSKGALQRFLDYQWPGNIRELENLIQRTMLMCSGDTITEEALPPVLMGTSRLMNTPLPIEPGSSGHQVLQQIDLGALLDTNDFRTPLAERLSLITDHVEKYLIQAALARTGGKRQESADLLGISRKSLHNKMVRYGLFEDE